MTVDISAFFRFGFPLCAVVCAAYFFARVGLFNLAMDGQIAVASIVYVIVANMLHPIVGLGASIAAAWIIGLLYTYSKMKWNLDPLLTSLGLYYACLGSALLMCKAAFGQPGYANLSGRGVGEGGVLVSGYAVVAALVLGERYIRYVRVSKVAGLAREIAELDGIPVARLVHLNGAVGSTLLALAALALTESGGTFTGNLAASRGFIALALVALTGPRVLLACVAALLFAGLQLAAYGLPVAIESIDALPYALCIIALGLRRLLTGRFSTAGSVAHHA